MNIEAHTQYANPQGGCYFATSAFGWHLGSTPWEAMANLDVTVKGKTPAVKSKKFLEATEYVYLWYIPDVEEFYDVDNFEPVDESGEPIGRPLYLGKDHGHNGKRVQKQLA